MRKIIYYSLAGLFLLAATGTVYAGINDSSADISTVGVSEVTCPGYLALGEKVNDPDFQCGAYCNTGTDPVSNCCGPATSE